MVAPVCGFRPLRAFLCDTENVPKPINATRSPLRRAEVTLSTAVSIAVVACALLISHAPAILSTRSALFMSLSSQVSFVPSLHREAKLAMAELENLTGGILLPLRRMSTVKIRMGSLFRTCPPRIGPTEAVFAPPARFSSAIHKPHASFTGCTQPVILSGLRETGLRVQSRSRPDGNPNQRTRRNQRSRRYLPALR